MARETSEKRVGARTMAAVPSGVLKKLNAGELETASLAEMLAMDLGALLKSVLPDAAAGDVASVREGGIVARLRAGGRVLLRVHGRRGVALMGRHPSDMVRSMACFMLTADEGLTLPQRLERVRALADDRHSGVREWAWIGVREAVAADVRGAVRLLKPWTAEESANLRRFASEVTRPRGVWCSHIGVLKETPELGLPLLEPLREDGAKYVQDSVANWLNDAGKTRGDWVREVCTAWTNKSKGAKETARIVKRAMRNL